MTERMTIFGVGPLLVALTSAYSVIPIILTSRYPEVFIISFLPPPVFNLVGSILLALGIPFWAVSVRTITKGFQQGVLCTDGVYSIVRHPLYSAIIVFIIPGILMFFRSWALFTIPFVAYFFFKKLINAEEDYLAEQFGDDYSKYKSRIHAILPIPRYSDEGGLYTEGDTSIMKTNLSKLKTRIILKLSLFSVIFFLLLFVPAGSLNFWEAWVYFVILMCSSSYLSIYFFKHNPELIEHRLQRKEIIKKQKSIQLANTVLCIVGYLIPGLDHRFNLSHIPFNIVLISDVMVLFAGQQ